MHDFVGNSQPYCLSDRWRGTFLGMVIGDLLPELLSHTVTSQTGQTFATLPTSRAAVPSSQNGGKPDEERDRTWLRSWLADLISPHQSLKPHRADYGLIEYRESLTAWDGRLAIATIPLAMYYHADLPSLPHQVSWHLGQWGSNVALSPEQLDAMSQLAGAIAHGLQGKSTPLCQSKSLSAMQPCGTAWEQAIAIACWAFLSTPNHPHLSLLQAFRVSHQDSLTCLLTGALSGSYNGLSYLPQCWRRQLAAPETATCLQYYWHMNGEVEVLMIADWLLAIWAGLYSIPLIPPGSSSNQHSTHNFQNLSFQELSRFLVSSVAIAPTDGDV
jgi:hypothetical protein